MSGSQPDTYRGGGWVGGRGVGVMYDMSISNCSVIVSRSSNEGAKYLRLLILRHVYANPRLRPKAMTPIVTDTTVFAVFPGSDDVGHGESV